ncbi:MAG: DUF4331 family protein [Kofleriaceae bacterium]
MKKKNLALGLSGLGLCVAIGGSIAVGADHTDSSLLAMPANAAADINDVYAWTSADASKLNLVMTVQPFAAASATFSPNVQYAFHVTSQAGYGMAATNVDVICEFASATSVQCWVGADGYVTGDPSATTGLTSADGKIKVFAGQRNDPFFFNLGGFVATVDLVKAAAGGLTFDPANCPNVDAATSMALVGQLQSDPGGGAATDDFAGANVAALVIQLDKTLVNAGGPILGVYASTHTKP